MKPVSRQCAVAATEERMYRIDDLAPVRMTCVCQNAGCGLRRVSLPLDTHQRAHGVECDRCQRPMTCVSMIAGRDPFGGETIWSDRLLDMRWRNRRPRQWAGACRR
jgi:hypothetical protein